MPGGDFILAIDQGTTSSRAMVYDREGRVVSTAQREFPQYYPRPGWVEHDPLEIWSSQSGVCAEALTRANLSRDSIAAVGITNQRETTLVWDRKTGEPVCPAIVWQDRRTAARCRRWMAEGCESLVRERTGLRLDPYFSGSKLVWILDEVPGVRARAERGELCFGTVDSWLLWKFTDGAVHATDASNASRTLLFNLTTGDWDPELLDLFGVPRGILPEVRDSAGFFGEIAGRHYPGGAPITGIAGDQHAALFGQACFEVGMAKNTYGTGCFLLMQTGETPVVSRNNLLTTVAWRIAGRTEYALEGSIFIAGAVIKWLRDELGVIETAADCDRLAAEVPDNGGVYLVPAFAGLGAPHWDPLARGAVFGLTRGANRKHLCRAALESIAFQSADLVTAMEADSGITMQQLTVDGGATRSDVLLQFQADLLGIPVVRPSSIETTALGAAFLAGIGSGFWKSTEALRQAIGVDRVFESAMTRDKAGRLRANWERAVERSRNWESE